MSGFGPLKEFLTLKVPCQLLVTDLNGDLTFTNFKRIQFIRNHTFPIYQEPYSRYKESIDHASDSNTRWSDEEREYRHRHRSRGERDRDKDRDRGDRDR